jgi:SagB-type dehydrogenase family enzyme
MTQHNDQYTQAAAVVTAYHQRTKHHLERYAAGPETLDWTMQPDPFREFAGSPRVIPPLGADRLNTPFARVYDAPEELTPHPVSLASLATLLELSMGISAWKEYGPDRWALRCNPSSGNLHPTEAYVLCIGVDGLQDGVYHYLSRDHILEQRCRYTPNSSQQKNGVWIALSSIHWREAWKYGERAFRYCQHDVGHALGALRYAAGALGWRVKMLNDYANDELATLFGLNRDADFVGAEKEDPDVLLAVLPQRDSTAQAPPSGAWSDWRGQANLLDPHPMYRWPVIAEVAAATAHHTPATETAAVPHYPPLNHDRTQSAAQIIRARRSAQAFDGNYVMPAADFYHLLDCLLARNSAPWDIWNYEPRLHPVLFVHRVADLIPGLYALPRTLVAETALRASLHGEFQWQKVAGCPDHIPLFLLAAADCGKLARTVSCHQAIAATGCFSLGMLAEFTDIVEQDSWRYRQLHWEAGLIGQVLYLEAEAAGVRGTGIGCFFDDAVHDLLGLRGTDFQTLYHFTVGRALVDERITTLPPYAERAVHTIYKAQST